MSIEESSEGEGAQERRSQRFKVSWPSRVLMPNQEIVAARTKDVSAGGVGFELIEQLPLGAEISIELSPWHNGQQHIIRARCTIMYSMLLAKSAGFSHGAKFSVISADQMSRLKVLMKGLESR